MSDCPGEQLTRKLLVLTALEVRDDGFLPSAADPEHQGADGILILILAVCNAGRTAGLHVVVDPVVDLGGLGGHGWGLVVKREQLVDEQEGENCFLRNSSRSGLAVCLA